MGWTDSVFGSKPQVAMFKKLKPGDEQKNSLLGNIANFNDIAKLGELYRQNMIQQQNELLPGYSETLAKGEAGASKILDVGNNLLSGELPQDVKDQVLRSSAYQSLAGGYAGSGMSRSLTARDLGLTSLDLMRQGASMIGQGGNSAQQWAAMARGDMLNPAASFISPEFTANFDLQNSVLRQQSLQNKYNVQAAPDPVAKGVSDTLINLIGAYLGKGGGGGGTAANSYMAAGSIGYNDGATASSFDRSWTDQALFGSNEYGGSNLMGGW